MKKRLLSFVLAVLMIASLLPATVLAADIVASGTCGAEGDGSNLTWTLDSDGMLKIEGSGKMEDYMSGEYDTPWCNYNRQIQEVSISAGVTYILSLIHIWRQWSSRRSVRSTLVRSSSATGQIHRRYSLPSRWRVRRALAK